MLWAECARDDPSPQAHSLVMVLAAAGPAPAVFFRPLPGVFFHPLPAVSSWAKRSGVEGSAGSDRQSSRSVQGVIPTEP